MEQIKKEKINWKCDSIGTGTYEGGVKNGMPDGLGRWKADDGENTVEGEWKNGQVNGKVIDKRNGYRVEYEAKNGKKNGKELTSYADGRW